jgi:hypothetical protein
LQSAFDGKVKHLELHVEEKLIKQIDEKILNLQLALDDKVKNIEISINQLKSMSQKETDKNFELNKIIKINESDRIN